MIGCSAPGRCPGRDPWRGLRPGVHAAAPAVPWGATSGLGSIPGARRGPPSPWGCADFRVGIK